MKTLTTLVLIAALAGCGKKTDKAATEGSAAAPAGSSAPVGSAEPAGSGSAAAGSAAGSDAAAGSAAAAAEIDLPVASDFEEEAAAKITAANLDAELKTLEQELTQ